MFGDCSAPCGWEKLQASARRFRAVALTLLIGAVSLSAAHAQKSATNKPVMPSGPAQMATGPNKPLPAASNKIVYYTPQGQQQLADAILTKAIEGLKDDSEEHFHIGEYNHSINICRIVVQGNPREVNSFSNAAYLYWSTGQNDAAIDILKKGLAANTDNYYMYDELGSFYFLRIKDYPTAITYYEQAVKFKCPFFTWTALGHCYEKVNQWEKAVKAWESASNYVGGNGMPASVARQNSQMIQNNLRRVRAELARHQQQ